MIRFSANLGFLWNTLPLPDAIRTAHAAGFDAVECHWPFEVPTSLVSDALAETGLEMLGLNTRRGDVSIGDSGLAAIPGRKDEARAAIDEALNYADAIKTGAVHVMAGNAQGSDAHHTFLSNLSYAVSKACDLDITILIEPLNRHDAPDYFLRTTDQAREIINEVGSPRLKIMFDCYHVGRTEGDVLTRLADLLPIVGHIQFAAVPDRGPPDHGELDYTTVFQGIERLGWDRPLGAEYKSPYDPSASLAWLGHWRETGTLR